MSRTSSRTHGASSFSPDSSGLSRSTLRLSTSGKCTFSRAKLSLTLSVSFVFEFDLKSYLCIFCVSRVYEHIYGNCEKKEIDFQDVIEHKFGHKKLCDLLMLLHND